MRYGLFSFFVTLVFVFSFAGNGSAAGLKDIPGTSSSEINYLLDRAIVQGYPDGTFRPEKNLTRDEAAIMIGKALKLDGTKRKTVFPDVDPKTEASGYIQSAYEKGIITGRLDDTYGPKDPMTRGQMAFLLQRAFQLSQTSKVYFKDIATSGAQYDAIDKIATAGLTNGYPNGTFQPAAYITRAEFALFVARGLNESFRVTISEAQNTIAIDAGHGGHDPGAIGVNNLREKELNLSVALKVETRLKQKGIQVIMTRRDDTFLSLDERVSKAVNSYADTFVSIHANSASASASGTETYYSTAATRADNSKQLATFIQNRLYPALGTQNRGVKSQTFRVIHANPLPAALVELGFITNTSDGSKLASEEYRNKAAEAIALGIQDYYNWKTKETDIIVRFLF